MDLQQVVAKTGIPLDTIRRLAQDFYKAERALVYGRFGVSMQEFGTLSQWLIHVINILTGNFDREGGVLFTKPAFDMLTLFNKKGRNRGSFARRFTRLRKLPETNGEFPVVTLADEILTAGKGQIKALFTIAGNPVLHTVLDELKRMGFVREGNGQFKSIVQDIHVNRESPLNISNHFQWRHRSLGNLESKPKRVQTIVTQMFELVEQGA